VDEVDDVSRVQTEQYPHLILHDDILFARVTHRQLDPFARPHSDILNVKLIKNI